MKKIKQPVWKTCPLRAYGATARLSAVSALDGSLLRVGSEYLVRFLELLILLMVWRSLAAGGVDLGGMTLDGLLTYTLMSSVLRQQLEIITPATSALWEGSVIGRYTRPMPVLGSYMVETVGHWWIPVFCLYSAPVLLLSPLLGVSPFPESAMHFLLFLPSLALSVSLGFALDFIFSAFAMRLKNGCWAAMAIRESLSALLSGAAIPFALLPFGIGKALSFLPFGSIASAPLSIYSGAPLEQSGFLLGLQVFWNLVIWPISLCIYHKSEERMISFGG